MSIYEGDSGSERPEGGLLSRRDLLGRAAVGTAGLGAASLLAGTPAIAKAAASKVAAATPKHGGTMTMAINTDGAGDTFDPGLAGSPSDVVRLYLAFDPLVRLAPDFKLAPGLALEWNANKDATVYEIKLRQGVVWHDGKKFTADDVIYSLRRMGSPTNRGNASVTNVRLHDLKKLNDHTVRVPLLHPDGDLQARFVSFNSSIVVQNGATAASFSKPIGTGPFMVTGFTPGQSATSVRNPNYWDHPKPYLDALNLTSILDDTARFNAVLGGQAQYCTPTIFPLAKANQHNSSVQLLVSQSGPSQVIYMRLDKAPFTDNRVREALKLIVDRQAMVNVALDGYGTIANDVYGHKGITNYDTSLPQRQPDIEKAKSLLKAAGQSDLQLVLQTSDVTAGITPAAALFAQQAAKAGVKVMVKTVSTSQYFNSSTLYGKMPFAQDTWPIPSLPSIYAETFLTSGPANETHLTDHKFRAALNTALQKLPGPARQHAWNQVQASMRNSGGSIVWASRLSVDALAPTVRGQVPGWVFAGNDQHHYNLWLTNA